MFPACSDRQPPIYGGNWEQVSVYCTHQIFYSGYVAVWVAVISH